MDWEAIRLSLRLSACTTAILLVLGIPIARWLAFSSWRGRFLVEAVVALPLVLPPTVLGFYVLLAISPRSPVGKAYEALTGGILPFSFPGLLIASVLYSLPFAVQPFTSAFAAVDRRLVEASWCLGVSRAGTFVRVLAPLAVAAALALLVFLPYRNAIALQAAELGRDVLKGPGEAARWSANAASQACGP